MAIATELGLKLVHNPEIIEQLLVDGYREDLSLWANKSAYRAAKLAKALEEGDSYVLRFFPAGGRPITQTIVINAANWRAGYALYRASPQRIDEGLMLAAEDMDKMLYHMSKNTQFVEGSTENNTVVQTVTIGSGSSFSYDGLRGW